MSDQDDTVVIHAARDAGSIEVTAEIDLGDPFWEVEEVYVDCQIDVVNDLIQTRRNGRDTSLHELVLDALNSRHELDHAAA